MSFVKMYQKISAEKKIIAYLKENPDKKTSIYDFKKILKQDDGRYYSYSTIYTVIKTLELKNIMKLSLNKDSIRNKIFVNLNIQ